MPAPMNPAAARVIDPVLTTVARGYRNAELASHWLFPLVEVAQRGGTIIKFSAEDFAKINTARSPGATRQTFNFGYSDDSYALVQNAIDGQVSTEALQEAAVVGIDQASLQVRMAMNTVMLQIEIAAATLATTAANYASTHKQTLAAAAQWSHANAKPAAAIETAKEAIAAGIGREPNLMVVGPAVYRALKNNPDVIDRIKHTDGLTGTAAPMVNKQKLAAYFDVDQFVVGEARTGTPGAFKPIWGKNVVLAYSDVTALAAQGSPSYGYTYRLRNYPMVEPGWFDKTCDSWRYPVTSEDTPVIAGAAAGYLISTAVA